MAWCPRGEVYRGLKETEKPAQGETWEIGSVERDKRAKRSLQPSYGVIYIIIAKTP
jgi:hypothetical protein